MINLSTHRIFVCVCDRYENIQDFQDLETSELSEILMDDIKLSSEQVIVFTAAFRSRMGTPPLIEKI